jgi:dTMP kinase
VNRVERPQGLESPGGPLGDPGEGDRSRQHRPGAAGSSPGCFVVLEGIDGCGKTTQLEHLGQWLPTSGLMPAGARLLTSREPGGTPLGQVLRELLLHPPAGASPCSDAELLLYAADRAQHVSQVIRPALAAGDWVLCDRFSGSTAAYQGYGRGLPLERIAALEGFATGGLEPDLTLWLDLPLEESLRRRGGRAADRIEASGHAFLERVAAGFVTLARQRGWQRVDASQRSEVVTQACQATLLGHAAWTPEGRADG